MHVEWLLLGCIDEFLSFVFSSEELSTRSDSVCSTLETIDDMVEKNRTSIKNRAMRWTAVGEVEEEGLVGGELLDGQLLVVLRVREVLVRGRELLRLLPFNSKIDIPAIWACFPQICKKTEKTGIDF